MPKGINFFVLKFYCGNYMDGILDREKVTKLFKEISYRCRQIEGRSLRLMPPNADSVYSKGYQIHISPNNDLLLQDCIERIAKSNYLAIAIEKDTLIIFNPIKK